MQISAGCLYVVSTPIGNLSDMTERAIETLRGVDLILCEDTRVFGKLALQFGIRKKTLSFFDANESRRAGEIVKLLESGQSIALVSDAGTPLLSDPGYRLVRLCRQNKVAITVIPGASSITAALAISGLPTDRFLFVGFLPRTEGKKLKLFQQATDIEATLVFFESPNRIVKSVEAIAEKFPSSELFIGRELTKMYEECFWGSAAEVNDALKRAKTIKGEFVGCFSGKEL